jgi:hypothetical protein
MAGYVFQTPANIQDFQQASSYQQWSDWISGQNDANIQTGYPPCSYEAGVMDRYPEITQCQYYNPAHTTVSGTTDSVISWNGFPNRIKSQYPPGSNAIFPPAEPPKAVKDDPFLQHYFPDNTWQKYANVLMRVQDEYLEWFATKDASGKVVRVDFTCEGPEYWQSMYQWEKSTLLKLYQQFISPNVQMADLEWTDPMDPSGGITYNPYNKWNTTQGIMHLNCPPNSLGAEINLAAFATVLRKNAEGQQITNFGDLIDCAQYGNPTRNSDPNIGGIVNSVCTGGEVITCTNPVGLYIQSWDFNNWTYNGQAIPPADLNQIVQIKRGYAAPNPTAPGRVLRLTIEVPEALKSKYTLSEILVGNTSLQWGGQIALGITMSLAGTHGKLSGTNAQPLQSCQCVVCPNGLHDASQDRSFAAASATLRAAKPKKHYICSRV